MSLHRRILGLALVAGLVVATTATSRASVRAGSGSGSASAQADAIREIVRETMAEQHMKAAIVSVNVDGKNVLTEAFGDTVPDVPATTDMYFRNGAVAFAVRRQPAPAVRRRGQGQSRRHDRSMAARPAGGRQGHAADAGEPDRGLPRLRTGSGVDRGLLRRSVPQLDVRGTAHLRAGPPAPVRARATTGATRTPTS